MNKYNLFIVCTAKEGVSLNFIIVKCILWWLYWPLVINLGMDRCRLSTVPGNNEFCYPAPKIFILLKLWALLQRRRRRRRRNLAVAWCCWIWFSTCVQCALQQRTRCRTMCRSVNSYCKDQAPPHWRTSASYITCIIIAAVTRALYVSESFFLPSQLLQVNNVYIDLSTAYLCLQNLMC